MKIGQLVKLRAYGNKELLRRIIRLEGDIVIVCRPEEYEAARREGREPTAVGFHTTDVIGQDAEHAALRRA
jgi:hypothetical protein